MISGSINVAWDLLVIADCESLSPRSNGAMAALNENQLIVFGGNGFYTDGYLVDLPTLRLELAFNDASFRSFSRGN